MIKKMGGALIGYFLVSYYILFFVKPAFLQNDFILFGFFLANVMVLGLWLFIRNKSNN
jgi:hypothetical protein